MSLLAFLQARVLIALAFRAARDGAWHEDQAARRYALARRRTEQVEALVARG